MRVVAYLRVSSVEQAEGYSIDAQRRAIELQCAASEDEIVAEYSDEGISAKFDQVEKRPGFTKAVEAVERGDAEAIMVHKFDRAARHMLLFLSIMQRLKGGIISVTQHANYATPEGRFFVHMLANMAQYYSDNLATEILKGKRERKQQGYYNGRLPLGLRKQEDDPRARKPPVRDERPAFTDRNGSVWSRWDVVQFIFQQAAAGVSTSDIARDLTALGFRTAQTTIWETVSNRFYIGELPEDGKSKRSTTWTPGSQGVFIEPALFEQGQLHRERNRRGAATVNHRSRIYPLSGITKCGRCGSTMFNNEVKHRWRLRCGSRQMRKDCDQPSILAEWIEGQMLECLGLCKDIIPRQAARELAKQLTTDEPDYRGDRGVLQTQLRKLKDLYVLGDMQIGEYVRRKGEFEQRLARLEAPRSDESLMEEIMRLLTSLPEMYLEANWEERNRLLGMIFTTLQVDGRRLVKVGFQPQVDRLWALLMSNSTDSLRKGAPSW